MSDPTAIYEHATVFILAAVALVGSVVLFAILGTYHSVRANVIAAIGCLIQLACLAGLLVVISFNPLWVERAITYIGLAHSAGVLVAVSSFGTEWAREARLRQVGDLTPRQRHRQYRAYEQRMRSTLDVDDMW